jgi:hypothetical protein
MGGGGLGLNEIQLKWIMGTDSNLKDQNPGGPFWSYLLNRTANPAHLQKMSQMGWIGSAWNCRVVIQFGRDELVVWCESRE